MQYSLCTLCRGPAIARNQGNPPPVWHLHSTNSVGRFPYELTEDWTAFCFVYIVSVGGLYLFLLYYAVESHNNLLTT